MTSEEHDEYVKTPFRPRTGYVEALACCRICGMVTRRRWLLPYCVEDIGRVEESDWCLCGPREVR